MDMKLMTVVGLTLLLLVYNHDTVVSIWHKLMFFVHVASGRQLFEYVMLYSPDDVSEEDRVVKALIFSNDQEYIDKVMEVMEE